VQTHENQVPRTRTEQAAEQAGNGRNAVLKRNQRAGKSVQAPQQERRNGERKTRNEKTRNGIVIEHRKRQAETQVMETIYKREQK